MNYIVLRSFIKKFDSYHKQEQEIINRAIEDIKQYLETNQAWDCCKMPFSAFSGKHSRREPSLDSANLGSFTTVPASHGLRIKKLSEKIYEGRINIHLRIAFFRDKDAVKFFCLGSHDDIRRCLKSFK